MTQVTTPVQAELTFAAAFAAYDAATHAIRARIDPPPTSSQRPEGLDIATAHVVMGLRENEAVAILRYLVGREGLAQADVILAKALARRLGVTVEFTRKALGE